MDPQQRSVAIEFDRRRETYAQTVDSALAFTGLKADFFTRVKARSLQDLVSARLGDPKRVRALDFGCGIGNYGALLAPGFGALTGVDVSGECIEQARRRRPALRFESYDGATLPFDDGAFDLAFAITVFHHIPPTLWRANLQEIRRVLRPGGLAVIYEHNPLNPLTMHVVNSCPFDDDACFLRKREVEAMLTAGGFCDVEARTILTLPPIGPIGRALDACFAKLPLGAQYLVAGQAPAS